MLSLILVLGLVTGAAPSAAAADLTDKAGWINLLDYTTVESASNFFVVSGTKQVSVSLPYQTNLFYVDMVLYVNGSGLSSAKAIWPNSGSSTSLSIFSLGNSLYRVYGAVPSGNYSSFKFSLTSSGTSYVTCQYLRVCCVNSILTGEVGSIYFDGHTVVSMSKPSTPVNYLGYSDIGSYGGTDQVVFNVPSWYKYDAVDIVFQVECESIVYVSSYVGAYNIPVSLTYLGSADGYDGTFYAVATINLEGVPRDLPYELSMKVGCDLQSNQFPMALREVNGIIYIEPPSPLQYWFRNLFGNLSTWFTNVINAVNSGFSNVGTWLSSGFQSVVNKLDELVTGGSAGDKVSSGGNKIEQSSGSLSDNMDQIQDFEDQQFGNLDAGMGTVIAGGDVSYLVAPLGFIHTYTNKIVAAIPSSYLVVFTLPMLFGVFMFIVGHPIRAPQPDTSGDQVTRETFTTTTVLDGKHKGSTTTTRTVTTSQEIGRRHTE